MRQWWALLITLAGISIAHAAPLKMGYGSHNAPPYAYLLPQQPTVGLLADIATALTDRSGQAITMVAYPRPQAVPMLASGQLDLICITNPAWLGDSDQQKFWWSQPLLNERNLLLVASSSDWRPNQVDQLAGKRIGMVSGYTYPALSALGADQQPERVDGNSPFELLPALGQGKLDGVIIADLQADHYLRTTANADHLEAAPVIISSHPVYCAFSRQQAANEQLRTTLNQLIEDGVITTLVDRYRWRN